jgi:hypothetical protein
MTPRLFPLAAALLLAGLALPAAADDDGPSHVLLTETTTVVASGSGTLDVLLPRTARVALAGGRGVELAGPGRLVGIWLEAPEHRGDFLTSYRLPAFAGGKQVTYGSVPSAACEPHPSAALPLGADCTGAAAPSDAVLRAGRYRLTVLADGPLTVTLRLRGLRGGESTTEPSRALASVQQALPPREGVGTSLVTFGGAADVGTSPQTFLVARARSGDGALQESSACVRPDAGTTPFAFGPQCLGGTSGSYSYEAGGVFVGAGAFASSSSEEASGPVGIGGSFGDSSGVQDVQALGVWLADPRA